MNHPPCDCGAEGAFWGSSFWGTSGYFCAECHQSRRMAESCWKIQTATWQGWADIKTSDDGSPYYVLPMTHSEAQTELDGMVEDLGHRRRDYRIVRLDVVAEFDLY